MTIKNLIFGSILILSLTTSNIYSQGSLSKFELSGQLNAVQSAVPFLTIAPDSRAGAMGDAGVATSPDVYSIHWNPAKYAFIEKNNGISLSYTPWLRHLIGDIDLATVAGFYRIDRRQVVAASLVYFALGDIEFTDQNGAPQKTAKPNEFSIDACYSRQLNDYLSGGIAFRYIHSDLASGTTTNGIDAKAGNSFAADISAFYTRKISIKGYESNMSFGANISNIGTKISYSDELKNNKDFLPTNLRLGGALKVNIDPFNSITLTTDFNKLLVPTSPVLGDSTVDGKTVILYGKDPDVSVVSGIFQSFTDAPGGFKEELHEINYSIGAEYWYHNQFAIRTGYFHEHATKGNRKYFTFGCGIKLNVVGIDVSYLIPTAANNPLANTLRFSLNFDLESFKKL